MKKIFAAMLVLAILAGGYMALSGRIRPDEVTDNLEKMNLTGYSGGKAETVSVRTESALEAAERLDEQLWSSIRRDDTKTAPNILMGMGYPEETAQQFISEHKNAATAMNKRYVHILAESGDLCVAEAVHYLVTYTNGGKDYSESNSSYWLYLRRTDGIWAVTPSYNDEEAEILNEMLSRPYKAEANEAAAAGRNVAGFGNRMWTRQDGVEEGVYLANTPYMYQEANGDVVVIVCLANGTGAIKNVKEITVTLTDDKLGQVFKKTEKCSVRVLPGTVELYEFRVPASKVKKGTWGTIHSDVDTKY